MWIEEAVGLGLGYLVYKQIRENVSDTPINITPTATPQPSKGMLGFGDITSDELATAMFGGTTFTEAMKPWKGQPRGVAQRGDYPFELPEGAEWGIAPPMDFGLGSGITRLTFEQAQEIGGPSRTGLTRPKGLD